MIRIKNLLSEGDSRRFTEVWHDTGVFRTSADHVYLKRARQRYASVKILKEPKNAILKQYQKLLALDEVRSRI